MKSEYMFELYESRHRVLDEKQLEDRKNHLIYGFDYIRLARTDQCIIPVVVLPDSYQGRLFFG